MSFEAINCTGTDNQIMKQNTTYTRNIKEKQKKTALADKKTTL